MVKSMTAFGRAKREGEIKDITVEHNVYNGDVKGMNILVDFDVNGMKGLDGKCSAYFYYQDGGKVVDFTAVEGYYKVDNTTAPSMFAGGFGASIKESFSRIKYGGVPSNSQKVYFINLQEIKGIKFGTRNPINYFDSFYNAELFLRAHGTYSIKITDPLKFFSEVVPRNADHVDVSEINEQYLNEFLEALTVAINRMSTEGIRISHVASKSTELSRYMASELDAGWKEMRGIEVQAVGIASVSYDEESRKLIDMRNQGAMLSDASVREG